MSAEHPEINELSGELMSDEEPVTFESGSLIRELRKSVARGDDEITLILAKAYCRKTIRESGIAQACIIYARVSTEQQAYGTGLTRQLQVCSEYARQKDYLIDSVFCEVASGADPLPIRSLVERIAVEKQCLILCEDHTRWSRQGASDVPPRWVIMCSQMSALLDQHLREAIAEFRESV